MATERRVFGRRTVAKAAEMVFEGGRSVSCIVTNQSDNGVALQFSGNARLETLFCLLIPGDDFKADCEIVHSSAGALGAKFVKSPQRMSWGTRTITPGIPRMNSSIFKRGSE